MSKNVSVTINTLGARGDGVGELDGKPVYVPFALPGETITASIDEERKNGLYASVLSVEHASELRNKPPCSHFTKCGGCQLQHLNTETYQDWVRDRAAFALKQHGIEGITVDEPFITPLASRRRVAMKAINTVDGLVLGFNQHASHQLVDVQSCPVARADIVDLLTPLRGLLGTILPKGEMTGVHITAADSGIDVLIEAQTDLSLHQRETCVAFANDHELAAMHWQVSGFLDPVIIRREPVMKFAGAVVPLPPATFIQATAECQQVIQEVAIKSCEGAGRVADLFSGIGTFTFPLAKTHQVLAVEGARGAVQALEAARNGAQRMGQPFKQIVTRHRDLFRRPLTAGELAGFDAVVIDPPRAGAQAQMEQLSQSAVKKIVSVSCNPNTFARDAKLLVDGGYTLQHLLPVGQFLWSSHIELVGVFERV